MVAPSMSLSYGDLQRLRETRGERLELVDGELVVTPSPTPQHQRVSRRLHRLLQRFIIDAELGEFFGGPLDVRLTDRTVVLPDLVVLLSDRLSLVTESHVDGSPSLVIEIISSSTRHVDHSIKRDLYARYGVPEYWLVDPEHESITIYSDPETDFYQSHESTKTTAISATIPGLSVDLKRLFSRGPDNEQ